MTDRSAWDDEALAEGARAGDHLAFAEIYRRYEPIFAAYVLPRVGDAAADVLQSAFLAVLKGLPSYRGPRFFPWAYRICVNCASDELRRRKRRPVALVAQVGDRSRAVDGPTPEEELVAKRLGERIGGALSELPEGQRAVFLLARVEGLDYAEIGALLGIPVGTVKSRMWGAVRALLLAREER